ncbi:MAG: DUF4136 domain-containing protein [Burkholderiaceae bacterium]
MMDCKRRAAPDLLETGWQGRIGRLLLLAALTASTLLAGCALPLRGELTTFHQWPAADAPRTYRFVRTPDQRDSLEHAAYERVLAAELARAGFTPAASPRYEVGFEFGSTRRAQRVAEWHPVVTPYFWFGTGWRHGGIGFSGVWPGWGPTYYPVERDRLWYDHRLRLEIRDLRAQPPQRVYEGTAVSSDAEPSPGGVLPLLARGILEDFPGPTGVTRRIEVPKEAPAGTAAAATVR